MFLCKTCHPGFCVGSMMPSYGRCEACSKTAECTDCHSDCRIVFPDPKPTTEATP